MIAGLRPLAGLFLIALVACNDSGVGRSNMSVEIKDHFKIDTNVILTNQKLLPLIDELSNEQLQQKRTYQEIPLCIRSFLDSLTGTFLIANPGETWQVGCSLPVEIDSSSRKISIDHKTGDSIFTYSLKDTIYALRQLNYFGLGKTMALMKYYSGGIAKLEHILIFKISENKVFDFWSGVGQLFIDNPTKDEILQYLKDNEETPGKLNSNVIDL